LPTAQCHATMLAVTVPLAVLCGAFYLLRGHVAFSQLLPYLPGGAVGAVVGSLLLPRIRPRLLRVVFALFLLYSGLKFTGLLQWMGVAL
ncbi:MAG: sulfite exporter TauE/SafE family protein, partial [Oscillospiraceae bacterium]|nr:sulfite exporter TauE/SafE family protein [Oscillospiraceae bacterium]